MPKRSITSKTPPIPVLNSFCIILLISTYIITETAYIVCNYIVYKYCIFRYKLKPKKYCPICSSVGMVREPLTAFFPQMKRCHACGGAGKREDYIYNLMVNYHTTGYHNNL